MKKSKDERQLSLIRENRDDKTRTSKEVVPPPKTEALKTLNLVIKQRGYRRHFLMDVEAAGTEGWSYFLLPAFKAALDIKYLLKQRKKNKVVVEEWHEWLQGSSFHFDRGHMIYDTNDAYDLPWSQALKRIRNCLQVTHASPASPEILETGFGKLPGKRHLLSLNRHLEIYDVLKPEPESFTHAIVNRVEEQGGKAPKITDLRDMVKLGGAIERKIIIEPRNHGVVHFDFYHPSFEKKGLVKGKSLSTTQDNFVRFLISGSVDDL